MYVCRYSLNVCVTGYAGLCQDIAERVSKLLNAQTSKRRNSAMYLNETWVVFTGSDATAII